MHVIVYSIYIRMKAIVAVVPSHVRNANVRYQSRISKSTPRFMKYNVRINKYHHFAATIIVFDHEPTTS